MWHGNVKVLKETFVRYYSRETAVNVRKINPKVPTQEAYSIARSLYGVIKQRGPLTVSNTLIHAKQNTHENNAQMDEGRKMLKLVCNQVGSNKKFLHCTLPKEPQKDQLESPLELKPQKEKPSIKKGKKLRE